MQPLLQQLSNVDSVPGGVAGYNQHMEDTVVPCIAQLAVAVSKRVKRSECSE